MGIVGGSRGKEGPEAEGVEASRCSGSREAEKNVGGGQR